MSRTYAAVAATNSSTSVVLTVDRLRSEVTHHTPEKRRAQDAGLSFTECQPRSSSHSEVSQTDDEECDSDDDDHDVYYSRAITQTRRNSLTPLRQQQQPVTKSHPSSAKRLLSQLNRNKSTRSWRPQQTQLLPTSSSSSGSATRNRLNNTTSRNLSRSFTQIATSQEHSHHLPMISIPTSEPTVNAIYHTENQQSHSDSHCSHYANDEVKEVEPMSEASLKAARKQLIRQSHNEHDFTHNRAAVISVIGCILEQMFPVEAIDPTVDQSPSQITAFHTERIPSISITDYLIRIAQFTECSSEALLQALFHISNLHQRLPNYPISALTIHRLLLTTVLLTTKFFDDQYYNNSYVAKVGGISTKELNDLEVEFLLLIQFELYIDFDVFRQFVAQLCDGNLHKHCQCQWTDFPEIDPSEYIVEGDDDYNVLNIEAQSIVSEVVDEILTNESKDDLAISPDAVIQPCLLGVSRQSIPLSPASTASMASSRPSSRASCSDLEEEDCDDDDIEVLVVDENEGNSCSFIDYVDDEYFSGDEDEAKDIFISDPEVTEKEFQDAVIANEAYILHLANCQYTASGEIASAIPFPHNFPFHLIPPPPPIHLHHPEDQQW